MSPAVTERPVLADACTSTHHGEPGRRDGRDAADPFFYVVDRDGSWARNDARLYRPLDARERLATAAAGSARATARKQRSREREREIRRRMAVELSAPIWGWHMHRAVRRSLNGEESVSSIPRLASRLARERARTRSRNIPSRATMR